MLEKYFDTESVVKVSAMNAILGMTDDWRVRHNFYWYVRETVDQSTGFKTKKLGTATTPPRSHLTLRLLMLLLLLNTNNTYCYCYHYYYHYHY